MDSTVTEITCHGRGAAFLADGNVTVIDIGGQDIEVIVLQNGKVLDFVMNDKCSAGTGKFLEVMANQIGLRRWTTSIWWLPTFTAFAPPNW
ncbi:BadF/BadG/BcrA/BcrD ATPase family protein [Treponema vincentii]|uniref:BadF/BadG/BcrA/BcrD ATPase family protein n=1 Tax=Treponema vincentii TaxID=69710 RepID=UPI003D8B13F1